MKSTGAFLSAVALATLLSPLARADNSHDSRFIEKAIEGNLAEVKVGQLAQRKGTSESVRHFGVVLERDHTKANQEAESAASSMGVTPPAQPGRKEQMVYRHLAGMSGERFDRAFAKEMVKDHEKDIAAFRKEAKTGSGPAADYAKASLPTLEKHLHMAEALESGAAAGR
jgi:putative membrane protein